MSTRENCLANIKTTLEANSTGGGYNYTPDVVTRADGPFFDWLDDSLDVMMFVEDGDTGHELETQEGL